MLIGDAISNDRIYASILHAKKVPIGNPIYRDGLLFPSPEVFVKQVKIHPDYNDWDKNQTTRHQ